MMDSQTKKETLHPQCLTLRVHSSILFPAEEANNDSGENEILLPSDVVLGSRERNRNEFTKFEGNDDSHDGRVCTREENAGISHVFVVADNDITNQGGIKNKIDDQKIGSRFDFVTSSAPETIVVQPSVDKIEEFGRRARARSEQQRQNRKAIKVIEGSPSIVEQERKQAKSRVFPSNTDIGKKRQRQQRRSKTQQLFSAKVARKTGQIFWTPDISQIPIPSKDIQSAYVQLHGLPIGSTFETIRKFFTGLVPERILVVLSNRTHISALDSSSYDDLSSYNLQDFIYTNRDVRILIKFDSVSAAGLAADRSGETVSSKHVSSCTFKYWDRQDGEKGHRGVADHMQDGFSIGVTKLSKEMAFSLSKLSFDALPGVPFHDCLSGVESKLNPKVRVILWTNTARACQVTVDSEITNANIIIQAGIREDNRTDEMNLLSFAEYKKHSMHYNRLLRIQEDLMASIRREKTDGEASASMDPIIRLTAHACMVIDHEMDRIDSLLYQHRASKKF
jgi:hypothetical protein